jgi:hypothetical protein
MTGRTNRQQDRAIDDLQRRIDALQESLTLLRGSQATSSQTLGEVSRLNANISVSTDDAPALDSTVGASQRLRLYVPTERTTVTLGR